jgi:hypothetical protein
MTTAFFREHSMELKKFWKCPSCDNITRRRRDDNTPASPAGFRPSTEHLEVTNMSCDDSNHSSLGDTYTDTPVVQPPSLTINTTLITSEAAPLQAAETRNESITFDKFRQLLKMEIREMKESLTRTITDNIRDVLLNEFNTKITNLKLEVECNTASISEGQKQFEQKITTLDENIKNLQKENYSLKTELELLHKIIQNATRNAGSAVSETLDQSDFVNSKQVQPGPRLTSPVEPNLDSKCISIPLKKNYHSKTRPEERAPKISAYPSSSASATKHKLIILSSNNLYKICNIIENNDTLSKFDYCHYITPGGGIRKNIHQIQNKLSTYTLDDYCVILIGEEDLLWDDNYLDLVQQITISLIPIVNTNIIISCPTYSCGKPIYNSKVEDFNTLLRNDIPFHDKHFSFDSNLDLSFDMFSQRTGRLSNRGMANIFHHLGTFVSYNVQVMRSKPQPESVVKERKNMQKKISDYFILNQTNTTTKPDVSFEQSQDFFRE